MKKVLFATTAIVAFAGAASADVALSGGAELGIADSGAAGEEVGFHSSVDVRFTMTGETDGGLAFGATVDLDDALETGATNQIGDLTDDQNADYTIFVSGAFGTLTFGDTDGAMDWALTEGGNVGNPGSLNDAETSYAGYAGSYLDGNGDSMIARYDYSFGDYAFAVSVEQDDNDAENGYAVGFKGNVAGVSFGIAHQEGAAVVAGNSAELTGISLGYGFGAVNAGLMIASGENAAGQDDDLMQIGLGYAAGAMSLHANYAEREINDVQSDGFGVAAKYDLGGGAGVHFGYSSSETGAGVEADRWSLGLAMSF